MSDPATDLGDAPIEHRFVGLDRRLTAPILALVVFWGGFVPWLHETVEGDELEPGTVLTVAGAAERAGWVMRGPNHLAAAIAATDDPHSPQAEAARAEVARLRDAYATNRDESRAPADFQHRAG